MKKRVFCAVSLFFALFLTLSFGGGIAGASALDGGNSGECPFEPAKRDVRRLMLGKYYVSSEENEEQELLWDFENRLFALCCSLDLEPETEAVEAKATELFNECCSTAESLGIAPEENARQNYFLTVQTESLAIDKKLSPEYFEIYARAELRIENAVACLAKLWKLTPDESLVQKLVSEGATEEEAEKEALKRAVMEYSVDNSKIVRRQKSVKLFFAKLKLAYGWRTNDQMMRPEYVVGENGYAALYNREYFLKAGWLEPFLGDLVAGDASCDAIYRFRGMEDWEWIIVRRDGEYALGSFVKWIEADGYENDGFVAIYGVEPKIHP